MFTQSMRESLADAISDMSKDVNGCRFRFPWQTMTEEELKAEFLFWERAVTASIDADRVQAEKARIEWESRIARFMSIGAKDRAQAIRWDMEGLGVIDGDIGYYCYEAGLSADLEAGIATFLRVREEV